MKPSVTDSGPRARWGLVLGGGGGRTFAHLGVLRALDAAGLRPDVVCGSSMGALIGALYARRADVAETVATVRDYFAPASRSPKKRGERPQSQRRFAHSEGAKGDGLHRRRGPFAGFRRGVVTALATLAVSFRPGLLRRHPLYRVVDRFFPAGMSFDDLALPFGCVAMDLTRAEVAAFRSGLLAPALKAGVAVGFVFAPFAYEGRFYADAAPASPVPVRLCRALGAEKVLAVDLCAPVEEEHHYDTGLDVVRRIIAVETKLLANAEIAEADLVLRPSTGPAFWADLSRVDEMAEAGEAAMKSALDDWRRCLGG